MTGPTVLRIVEEELRRKAEAVIILNPKAAERIVRDEVTKAEHATPSIVQVIS